jgi:lipoate-protein ligase A
MNMDFDYQRLLNLKSSDLPSLTFYDWQMPAFTYGYFSNIDQHLNLQKADEMGYKSGKRPTGGGIIFHSHDVAFSFLLPSSQISENTLKNYCFVNSIVNHALSDFKCTLFTEDKDPAALSPFCWAKPTIYDLFWQGKKVGGAAQRRTKNGLLHQGSLCVKPLNDLEGLFADKEHFHSILQNSTHLKVEPGDLKKCLERSFCDHFRSQTTF